MAEKIGLDAGIASPFLARCVADLENRVVDSIVPGGADALFGAPLASRAYPDRSIHVDVGA